MHRRLLHILEALAVASVAAGAGLIYLPAGLIVAGIAVVAMVEMNT